MPSLNGRGNSSIGNYGIEITFKDEKSSKTFWYETASKRDSDVSFYKTTGKASKIKKVDRKFKSRGAINRTKGVWN